MTEVVQYQPTNELSVQIEFARMVTSGERGQSILPDAYRGNPANALIAVGLGASMGLSPAESLYRINVIKGKPSAAAELIAANVRRAGHKLRVKVSEQPPSATCTIVRADDPDEPTVITRDMAWAQRMGLANEPNYKKQPETMLSYRAITACARLACPEALYGVSYTPDEAREISTTEEVSARPTAADFLPQNDGGADAPDAPESLPGAASVEILTSAPPSLDPMQGGKDFAPLSNRVAAMFAEFGRAGFTTDARSAEGRQARLEYCSNVIGRQVESSKDLSAGEVERVINALKADAAEGGGE